MKSSSPRFEAVVSPFHPKRRHHATRAGTADYDPKRARADRTSKLRPTGLPNRFPLDERCA